MILISCSVNFFIVLIVLLFCCYSLNPVISISAPLRHLLVRMRILIACLIVIIIIRFKTFVNATLWVILKKNRTSVQIPNNLQKLHKIFYLNDTDNLYKLRIDKYTD